MKKILIILFALILVVSLSTTTAFAGSKQRHRWQGVAIGVGAAILGNAILNNARDYSSREHVTVIERDVYMSPCPPPHRRGHWEISKIWMAPVCKRVWNPAHYNDHNRWVTGQWKMIKKEPGYWKQEKAWVAADHHRKRHCDRNHRPGYH